MNIGSTFFRSGITGPRAMFTMSENCILVAEALAWPSTVYYEVIVLMRFINDERSSTLDAKESSRHSLNEIDNEIDTG